MSDFMNQLNEKVPDHKTNVTSINSRRLKRDENGKIIKTETTSYYCSVGRILS